MAKKGINDEFYTPAEVIINELKYYGYDGFFKNKTVYLPCDYDATLPYIKKTSKKTITKEGFLTFEDEVTVYKVIPELYNEESKKKTPRKCQFVSYLIEQKEAFGIKDIYISGYNAITGDGLRFQDAPFDEFDVIITNPPFSQMEEWVEKILKFGKNGGEFLFLAPLSITTNTYAFAPFKNSDFWCGYTEPSSYEDSEGNKIPSYNPSVWITNLNVKKHKPKRVLSKSWKDHPDEFIPYWNFKGINVDTINDIPYDYSGVFGVSSTVLKDLHPDQFEIIGFSQGKEQLSTLDGLIDKEAIGYTTDMIRTNNTGGMYKKNKGTGGVASSKILIYTTVDNINPHKAPFCKILLKNKEIVSDRKYYDYEDVIKWMTKQLKNNKPFEVWSQKLFKSTGNDKVKKGKGESE